MIKIHSATDIQIGLKYLLHEPLECFGSIKQCELKNTILKESKTHLKCCSILTTLVYLILMVDLGLVNLAKHD